MTARIGRLVLMRTTAPRRGETPRTPRVFLAVDAEIVGVKERVRPRVVRRIDVDRLDFIAIFRLEDFQSVEIVPLDIEILRRIPIDAFLGTRSQRFERRSVSVG